MSAAEAGDLLGLPADVIRALADAGYLHAVDLRSGSPRFGLGDVKAFQARLNDGATALAGSTAWGLALDAEELDPASLLAALDVRSSEMAEQTLDLLAAVYPSAAEFSPERRQRFIKEARHRMEAIIALCARGPGTDEPLEHDLAEVGAAAAHAGVPLPGVLVALRITRDLVIQTAIETAEARGRHWGLALSVTLTRVLPAIDLLADAVARGYREAVLEIEAEGLERYRNLVERMSDGVFAVDADGIVGYVNPALSAVLARRTDDMVGRPIGDLLPVDPGVADAAISLGGSRFRVLQVERLVDGVVAGWDGIVRRTP